MNAAQTEIRRALSLAAERKWDAARAALDPIDEPMAFHLSAAIAELDRYEEEQRQYVAVVRHEIGNALAIVQASLEAIVDGVLEPTSERLQNMRKSLENAGALLDDLQGKLGARS